MAFPVGGYADLAAAIADGMLHYWPFDETRNYVAQDLIGGWDGRYGPRRAAAASILDGQYAKARSTWTTDSPLDLTSRIGRFELAALPSPVTHNDWTVIFKYRPHTTIGVAPRPFVLDLNTVSDFGIDEPYLEVHYGGVGSNNLAEFMVDVQYIAVGDIWHNLVVAAPTADVWHTVAIVNDSGVGEVRVYIDTVLVGTIATSVALPIGKHSRIGGGTNTARYEMDDLGIWNRALTLAEVQEASASVFVAYQAETGTPFPVEFTYDGNVTFNGVASQAQSHASGNGLEMVGGRSAGDSNLRVYVSADGGDTWTPKIVAAMPNTTRNAKILRFANGLWVLHVEVLSSDRRLYTSDDNGDTWTLTPHADLAVSANAINDIAYIAGEWVLLSNATMAYRALDPRGAFALVTASTPPPANQYSKIAADPNSNAVVMLYGTSAASPIAARRSLNGIHGDWAFVSGLPNFSPPASSSTITFRDVVFAGGQFLLVANSSRLYRSTNAVDWFGSYVPYSNPPFQADTNADFRKAFYFKNQWFVDANAALTGQAGGQFWVYSADNGENWEYLESISSALDRRVVFMDGDTMKAYTWNDYRYSGLVPDNETVTSAIVDVEVNVARPIVTAATVAIATVAVLVGVIAGTLREAEIDVPVGVTADAQGKIGAGDLLVGLTAFWEFQEMLPGDLYVADLHNSYDALTGFTGVGTNSAVPVLLGNYSTFPYEYLGGAEGPYGNYDVRIENFISLPNDFTISVWQYRIESYGSPSIFFGTGAPIVHTHYERQSPNTHGGSAIAFLSVEVEKYIVSIDPTVYDFRIAVNAINDAGSSWDDLMLVHSESNMPADEWLHFVIRRRKDVLDVFVNGVLEMRVPGFTGNLAPAGATWQFGAEKAAYNSNPNVMWGALDEIGVWDTALLDSEIQRLYSSGQPVGYPFTNLAEVDATIGVTSRTDLRVDYWNFAPADRVSRFVGVITGAEDGVEDVEIPISSWQATRQVETASGYLQMVVPAASGVGELLDARPNGRMMIRSKFSTGGYTWVEDFASSAVTEIRVTQTSMSNTIMVLGRELAPARPPITYAIQNPLAFSLQVGIRRARFPLDIWLYPGYTVQFGEESFVVGWINMYANNEGAFMDVGEFSG